MSSDCWRAHGGKCVSSHMGLGSQCQRPLMKTWVHIVFEKSSKVPLFERFQILREPRSGAQEGEQVPSHMNPGSQDGSPCEC